MKISKDVYATKGNLIDFGEIDNVASNWLKKGGSWDGDAPNELTLLVR